MRAANDRTPATPACDVVGSKPTVVLVSALPPPAGGIATWTRHVLASSLARRVRFVVVDTSRQDSRQESAFTWRRLLDAFRIGVELLRCLWRERPQVLHVNTSGGAGFFRDGVYVWLGRLMGARTVLQFHSSRFGQLWGRRRLRPITRAILGAADTVLVLSDQQRQLLLAAGISQTKQISNFVLLRPDVERSAPVSRPVRFLFVGWIMRNKGVLELLEALSRIEGAELILLGRYVDSTSESSRQVVECAIASWNLASRVRVPGEVAFEEVFQFYEVADVFVLPSYSEGFPNVLLEAMMSGLPTVVTNVGAMPEVVLDGETGFVIPPRDVTALERALRRLAVEPVLRLEMGKRGRAVAIEKFEAEKVLSSLSREYAPAVDLDES